MGGLTIAFLAWPLYLVLRRTPPEDLDEGEVREGAR
jgi:hypothetical protein